MSAKWIHVYAQICELALEIQKWRFSFPVLKFPTYAEQNCFYSFEYIMFVFFLIKQNGNLWFNVSVYLFAEGVQSRLFVYFFLCPLPY